MDTKVACTAELPAGKRSVTHGLTCVEISCQSSRRKTY